MNEDNEKKAQIIILLLGVVFFYALLISSVIVFLLGSKLAGIYLAIIWLGLTNNSSNMWIFKSINALSIRGHKTEIFNNFLRR